MSSGRAGLCERTALAIEADGHAEVVGEGVVFIVRMDETLPGTDWSPGPERVSAALRVHVSGDRLRLW
jgi:cyanophycinase-like exopeptidase